MVVRQIVNDFQELDVTRRSAHILRRAGVASGQADRGVQFGSRRQDLLDLDAMLPVISIMIDIGKRFQVAQRPAQGCLGFIQHGRIAGEVRVRLTIARISDHEFMQAEIRHCRGGETSVNRPLAKRLGGRVVPGRHAQ
jgi:hypothetical protein